MRIGRSGSPPSLTEANYASSGEFIPDLVRVVVEAEVDTKDIVSDESVIESLRAGFDLPEPEIVVRPGATVEVKAIKLVDRTIGPAYFRRPDPKRCPLAVLSRATTSDHAWSRPWDGVPTPSAHRS